MFGSKFLTIKKTVRGEVGAEDKVGSPIKEVIYTFPGNEHLFFFFFSFFFLTEQNRFSS